MAGNVLLKETAPTKLAATTARAGAERHWSVLMGAGAAFAVIGWTDVALLWYPLGFGSLDWEFGTLSASFDALPLGTIGLVMMSVAAIARGMPRLSRALAMLFVLVAALLAAGAGLYALSVLAGYKMVESEAMVMFTRAVIKTSVLAVSYITLYGCLAWVTARVGRR